MNFYQFPEIPQWDEILKRPSLNPLLLEEKVRLILNEIKKEGDTALKRYTAQFDNILLDDFLIKKEEIIDAEQLVSLELKTAIQIAAKNIEVFHTAQLLPPEFIETMPGVKCWRKNMAIEKVGLYIPGGTAPLFSTILMLGIPAKLAGCHEIILCSPPGKDGKLPAAVLYAAQLVGISKIFKIGGAQAIGAMAYGTETIPKVYKIFGPGNQYVTCAKQLIQQDGIAIDMPAGPSEVCVLADETANDSFVAADLLSQAEHGSDSQAILITTSKSLFSNIEREVRKQLAQLPRKKIANQALENSKVILVKSIEEGIAMVNEYAPEHLIIACKKDEMIAEKIINAGSVFLGDFSPESVGDYASGTNHTLPTNGFAKTYSGVSVDSFVKKITFQKLARQGLQQIGKTVEILADAEGLYAHKYAVSIRLNSID